MPYPPTTFSYTTQRPVHLLAIATDNVLDGTSTCVADAGCLPFEHGQSGPKVGDAMANVVLLSSVDEASQADARCRWAVAEAVGLLTPVSPEDDDGLVVVTERVAYSVHQLVF